MLGKNISGHWGLALVPFGLFWLGYFAVSHLVSIQEVVAPLVVGQRLAQALKNASNNRVGVRIASEVIDADMPEGTVVRQSPLPGSSMKMHQPLYLVVSTHPHQQQMIDCTDKSKDDIEVALEQAGIRTRFYGLENPAPLHDCIGQFPTVGDMVLPQYGALIYYSTGTTPLRIMPNCIGRSITQVRQLVSRYSGVLRAPGFDDDGVIGQQEPLPGAIIDISKEFVITVKP
jgi:beta-lactam-binding protein with PASTA domain